MTSNHRRNITRGLWTVVCGLFLGGLLTELAANFIPEGVARSFLTAAVEASVGPFSVDLVAVAFTVGPVAFALNVLTLVGIAIVAWVVRFWL